MAAEQHRLLLVPAACAACVRARGGRDCCNARRQQRSHHGTWRHPALQVTRGSSSSLFSQRAYSSRRSSCPACAKGITRTSWIISTGPSFQTAGMRCVAGGAQQGRHSFAGGVANLPPPARQPTHVTTHIQLTPRNIAWWRGGRSASPTNPPMQSIHTPTRSQSYPTDPPMQSTHIPTGS